MRRIRLGCCARAASGHAAAAPPSSVMNSRRLNRSNCISVPASQGRGLQDIELARISQQASVSLAELLNQSISYALRMSWRRSVPKMMVSDNFLDQLIGHRLHESVKGASRHRQLVDDIGRRSSARLRFLI
jgi:hypothetical protein